MRQLLDIALKHLLARKRQSLVSLFGIVLGVGFFLTISSLMKGSENDFLSRLVDNSPHITIEDDFRDSKPQPVLQVYKEGAVGLRSVKPETETRGIRSYEQVLAYLRTIPGVTASPTLDGQAIVSFAGKDFSINLSGILPEEAKSVTTIDNYMQEGSLDDLIANADGIAIGAELARRLALSKGDNITVAAPTGQVHVFKIVAIFRTGRANYDARQGYVNIKRVQAMFDRTNRVNNIIIKLADPFLARDMAAEIESRIGYKSISWQEQSEDVLSTLIIRNTIMYTVVSAVLIVAAFGIYNVISTVVMEKHRDIAILKSMGFHARDIQYIFLIQGVILGCVGCLLGLPLGVALMSALMQIRFKPPGSSEIIQMPLDWGWQQFAIAAAFAILSATLAAYLPARKGARVQPVDILRGGT